MKFTYCNVVLQLTITEIKHLETREKYENNKK